MGTAILWVHAVAGAIWIGACACFAIAGLALGAGSAEQHNFVTNAAPKIDVLGLVAAAVLLMTGVISLIEVGVVRGFAFSTTFMTVLAIKITLFIVMIAAMTWSMRIGAVVRAVIARGRTDAVAGAMTRMVKAHLAIAAMGGIALILGAWLLGS